MKTLLHLKMKIVPTLVTKCLMKIGVKRFVNEIDPEHQEVINRNIVSQILKSNFSSIYRKLWCVYETKNPK